MFPFLLRDHKLNEKLTKVVYKSHDIKQISKKRSGNV
jgi:hypothetical protein